MGTPLRVLIAEDSEDDATLLVRELKRGSLLSSCPERLPTERRLRR